MSDGRPLAAPVPASECLGCVAGKNAMHVAGCPKEAEVRALMAAAPKAPGRQQLSQADRNHAVIARADEKLRREVSRTMAHYMAAAQINDDGSPVDPQAPREPDGRPKGWSHVKHRIAKDGRRPVKLQPGYLASAARVFESYKRVEAGRVAAPQLNVELLQVVVGSQAAREQIPEYRVIDVTEEEPT